MKYLHTIRIIEALRTYKLNLFGGHAMNEHIVLCGIICVTVIILYLLSIVKSRIEVKRLELEQEKIQAEIELIKEKKGERSPHSPSK